MLSKAEKRKRDFESLPENNVFASLNDAERTLECRLEEYAREDCEGSHNVGEPTYTQRFTVSGVLYEGTLTVEYNRHDKRFYYVDMYNFTAQAVPVAAAE